MTQSPPTDEPRNLLGGRLLPCSYAPLTGFYRDGCCKTDDQDQGRHLVCARMTIEFLRFSLERGNDLVTPRAEHLFPGLKPGDWWCLCALRWSEALEAGVAPPVKLAATHAAVTRYVSKAALLRHAVDPPLEPST
jgi:uncharacterized protein (DUF2237 family)